MADWNNPFADPELTYKSKTARQRAAELEAEEKARDLETRLTEKRKGKKPATKPAPTIQPPNPPAVSGVFSIESLANRYRINGVMYNGEEQVVDLSKELLNGGESLTQDQHIERLKGSEFQLPDAALIYAIIASL